MTLAEELDQIMKSKRSVYVQLATRLVGPEDAEDVVQDALIRAFTKLNQFQGDAALGTWVGSIVLNTARMKLRSRFRHIESHFVMLDDEGWSRFSNPAPDMAKLIGSKRKAARVLDVMRRMPRCYRDPLRLRAEGLMVKEIAKELKVQVGTAKAQLHRGRVKLAERSGL